MKRTAIALLIAPLWAPAVLLLYAAFFSSPPDFMADVGRGSWIGMAVALGAVLGYLAVLAIGLPTHLMLRSRDWRSAGAYLATWFVLAVAIWAIAFVAGFARSGLGFSFSYLADTVVHRPYVPLSIGIVWAVTGATFWAIVRPDRERLRG